jgi:predicted aspartyl protease
MGIETMGKVLVTAKVENLEDLYQVDREALPASEVRRVEVSEALVDTGASILSMPRHLIQRLGLRPVRTRRARTSGGIADFQIYSAVRLTVQGRDCLSDVMEVPDDCPVLIGQIPLELLDYLVDPVNHRLIGNPDHGGEQMLELY